MCSTKKLEVSGVSFSSLIFEMMNSVGDQEGFLFGNLRKKVVEDISDSQLTFEKEEYIMGIHQFLPCAQAYSFCDRHGVIDVKKLKDITSAYRLEDLIGWYRFRRNSIMEPYYRERVIHQNLANVLPEDKRSYFLFGVFTTSTTTDVATHSIEYKFLQQNNKNFEAVSATVVNLGDTANKNYKTDPPLVLHTKDNSYGKLVSSIPNKVINKVGYTEPTNFICTMQTNIEIRFRELCKELVESEEELKRLLELKESMKPRVNTKNNIENKIEDESELIQGQLSRISLTKTSPKDNIVDEMLKQNLKKICSPIQQTSGRVTRSSNIKVEKKNVCDKSDK